MAADHNKKKNLMKFPSIFKSRAGDAYSTKPWDWPSCKHPKTDSFRAQNNSVVFKTVNSIFFEDRDFDSSLFTNSSATNSTVTDSDDRDILDGDSLETVVRGARSERLFFEPEDTSSILEKSKPIESEPPLGFKESSIVSIESANPYEDFRKSMGEMVESLGVRDWDGLEELLGWYLKANWKNNHGFIIGAFVDLLIHILLASSSSSSSSSSTSTSTSTSSTSCSNSDSNYYSCTELSSYSCASSLRSLDRSIQQEAAEEEDDDDNIREIV